MAQLVRLKRGKGDRTPVVINLSHLLPAGSCLTIGRGEGCGVVLRSCSERGPLFSRHHATVTCTEAGFVLEDHSVNGTYVNNYRIAKVCKGRRHTGFSSERGGVNRGPKCGGGGLISPAIDTRHHFLSATQVAADSWHLVRFNFCVMACTAHRTLQRDMRRLVPRFSYTIGARAPRRSITTHSSGATAPGEGGLCISTDFSTDMNSRWCMADPGVSAW